MCPFVRKKRSFTKFFASHKFIRVNLPESASIVASLASKLILLIVRVFVENGNTVICVPSKEKVFVGIDFRTIFTRLLEGCIELNIVLS